VTLTAQRSVDTVAGCPAPNCRMRHAQSEGTLGIVQWASGRREDGVATLRKSLAEFEALAAEDPANAVYVNAGAQVRAYLALALAAGSPRETSEALTLAAKNLRLTAGAEASLDKGRERILVNRITMGAALLGARRFADAEQELRETLESNRDWKPNPDLSRSALHLLTRALEAQGKFEDAVSTAKEATRFSRAEDIGGFAMQMSRALAALDYGSAVAGWTGANAEQRRDALRLIEMHCSGPDQPGGVIVGPLIEWFPAARDVAPIRDRLRKAR
jgi:tetratricopeptide (TPR) repeat protein